MSDPMIETPEETAALTAMREEQEIQLVQPEAEKPAETEKPAEQAAPVETAKPAETEQPKRPVRLVPHEALHEERIKRQNLERELAELRKPKAPAQEQSADIDENENPLGAIAALKAKLKAIEDQGAEAQRQHQEGREIVQRMGPRLEAYTKDHPEYPEQFSFVRQSRARELQLLGHDEQSIAIQVQQEEMALARHVLANDLDPGAVIASLAEARGWRAKEPSPAVEEKAAPKPAKEAVEKIDRIAKGQKAATSSSGGGGGGTVNDEPSIEDLLGLDGAAFDKAASKWIKDGKRAGA